MSHKPVRLVLESSKFTQILGLKASRAAIELHEQRVHPVLLCFWQCVPK